MKETTNTLTQSVRGEFWRRNEGGILSETRQKRKNWIWICAKFRLEFAYCV